MAMDRETQKELRKALFDAVFALRHKQEKEFERAGLAFSKLYFKWRDLDFLELDDDNFKETKKNLQKLQGKD